MNAERQEVSEVFTGGCAKLGSEQPTVVAIRMNAKGPQLTQHEARSALPIEARLTDDGLGWIELRHALANERGAPSRRMIA